MKKPSLPSNQFQFSVLPTTALQIANVQGADGLHAIQSGNVGIVQYATQGQDGQFYVPGMYAYIDQHT